VHGDGRRQHTRAAGTGRPGRRHLVMSLVVAAAATTSCADPDGDQAVAPTGPSVSISATSAPPVTMTAAAPGSAAIDGDRVATLGELLVRADEVDFLFPNGEPPLLPGDEYYEDRPTGLCANGPIAEPIAPGDVFNLLDDDAIIFFGQWLSGEAAADAARRFDEAEDALGACVDITYTNSDGDQIAFQRADVPDPGLDDVAGFVVLKEGEPYVHVVYARHGGLLTYMYFESSFSDWTDDQRAALIDLAFGKLLAAGPMELPRP
jgi:hypothetical protein